MRRRYRLGVRTEDSQSSNPGSIPGSATSYHPLKSAKSAGFVFGPKCCLRFLAALGANCGTQNGTQAPHPGSVMGRAVESLQRNGWGRNPLKAAPETLAGPEKQLSRNRRDARFKGLLEAGHVVFQRWNFKTTHP